MGAFGAKVKAAKLSGGGSNIRDGKYTFLVEKCHWHNGRGQGAFIAELRVIEATPSGEYEIAADGKSTTDKLVQPNPVGSSCSLVCSWEFESGPGNAMKFAIGTLAGFGYDENAVTEEVLDGIIGPKNPLHGMAVKCETYRDTNKGKKTPANRGNILVLQKWSGVPQTTEGLAKQRAYLASNASTTPAPAPAAQPAAAAVQPTPPPAPAPAPAATGASVLGSILDL